jgi:hypothetical protein
MAKSVQNAAPSTDPVAPVKGRFKVAVRGYPVMGFVDSDKKVHPKLPVETHYRRPAKDVDSDVPDGWHTERQLRESYGIKGPIPEGFRSRKRVRMDLTSALFEGAVVAADSDHEARDVFMKTYGLNDTAASNWKVKKAGADEPIGPYGPKKLRGLLAQGEAEGGE